MKSKENVDDIIGKVEEIRAFLKIGDEVIPFLGELFVFIKDIMPLMYDADISLHDGTNKLPDATDRISDVSQTTEMATNEILDKLDSISDKLTTISPLIQGDQKNLIDDIQGEIMDIIYALQFQDITSQKLDHASRILKAIYEKFSELLKSINQLKVSTSVGNKVFQAITGAIDNERREKHKKEFDEKVSDTIREKEFSQDDIDKLFS